MKGWSRCPDEKLEFWAGTIGSELCWEPLRNVNDGISLQINDIILHGDKTASNECQFFFKAPQGGSNAQVGLKSTGVNLNQPCWP